MENNRMVARGWAGEGSIGRLRLMYTPGPGGSGSKESACSAGDTGSIPGLGRFPGEGNGNPLQYSGKSHGQQSRKDYSPWDCKQ